MERSEIARNLFLEKDYNCAQSVVLSFADELKISKEVAQKMAAGFGGGMGKEQKTCGAVTGAVMVLGMLEGERVNNNDELKSRSYASVKKLHQRFFEEFGTTQCRELIDCDLNTSEGSERFRDQQLKEKVCGPCVARAVTIIQSLV
jgi:C_GCAxxG_C_C family probable redox protein